MPNELLPTTSTITIPYKSKRFSGSSIFMLQNANEYLTWDSLSQSIDSSIHDLNVAIQENMKQEYPECTSTIVGNVRIMLYATGTVEKDSVAIKKNKNLKYYHRNIMASLSKLVLSTKVAASAWPPPDAAQIMKSDANEVLGAVRKFIQIAQKTVDIRSVDPKVIESATGGSWHGNNLIQTQPNGNKSRLTPISSNINPENTSTSNSFTNNLSYHLTSDLINLLDKISCTVTQSIISLLNYVRKVIDAPNSSITSSFSSQLISQTKEILAQVGQFLFITENIDLKDFVESSFSTINEFNVSRQSLYNNIAGLVMCIQMASDPLFPSNAMDKILDCANVVDKSVKDIIIITKSLVIKIQGMRSRRPSTVENFEDSQRNSNNFNSLDQINGNNLEHFAENQSTIPSLDITNISVSKSSQTAPENDIVTNNDPKTSGSNNNDVPIDDSITNGSNFSSNNDDVPISPTSPTSTSRITGKLQRSYTHPSADNPPTPQVVSGSNTVGAKLQSKIIKDDVSSNVTQSQKQKEDKPWFLNYDYDSSEMVFNLENYVKGGTLNALIERLTMHDLLDSNFIATFLLTYRSFCSTDDFFDMLVKRFMIQPPEGLTHEELEVWQEKKQTPVRLRVFNIMKTWLEAYYIDDGEDLRCLEKMREFARTTMYEHMAFASVSLTKVIEKRVCIFLYVICIIFFPK
jgi:son of sevenless-like protein